MTKNVKPFALAMIAAISSTPVFTMPVWAADLTNYSEPPAASYDEPAPAGWGGAYVGVHGGMASERLNPFSGDKGLTLGAQAGYNMDLQDNVVVGGEVEASYLGDAEIGVRRGDLKERSRVAAKAKLGYSLDQTLVYGTAGAAMTNFRDTKRVEGPDGWKPGWILGAGVEQKLSSNISAKVEYNYTMTNDVKSFSGGVSSERDLRDHTIKAGVNYRF